jgi:hypothetical protein
MTIPKADPGMIPHLIGTLVSQATWQNTSAAANTLEATFYASLRGGVMQAGRLVNWLRETSIGYVNEIQILFNLANVGLIALSAKKLLDEVQTHYNFSIAKDGFGHWALKSAPVVVAVAGAVFLGWKLINRLSPTLAAPETVTKRETKTFVRVNQHGQQVGEPFEQEVQHTVDITETLSTQQKIGKVLHTTKLVLNVALACFVKNRFWFVVSFAMSGYSLWKNIQLKWITFSRDFPCQFAQIPATHLKPTYHMLALPTNRALQEEQCPVCLDEEVEKMAFCANHAFCKACLGTIAHKKSAEFSDASRILKTSTRHYQNGVYTGTSHNYSIKIDKDKLPSCPTCRDVPLQNTLSVEVTDRVDGRFDASVTIERPPVDRQYLFENLYAIYNTAQAGLAFLQTYPVLAATIYKIQKVMLVTDFVGYAVTAYYLFEKVNAKFNRDNSIALKVGVVAAIALTSVLSWYIMVQINAYLKPAILLNDVMKQMGLSPDVLKTLNLSFASPRAHQVMQALLINRIIATAALTYFSNQKKTSLVSLFAQIGSFVGISALKWIEVIQTLEQPLKQVVASGGKLIGFLRVSDVKSAAVTHHFLVSSSCLTHIQSTLKSISNFTVNFFNKSSWENYWMITYTNGVETGRRLYYAITLQNNVAEACGCTLTPALTDTTIKVVDAFYGAANVVTRT